LTKPVFTTWYLPPFFKNAKVLVGFNEQGVVKTMENTGKYQMPKWSKLLTLMDISALYPLF
jgi:hypothetical protein